MEILSEKACRLCLSSERKLSGIGYLSWMYQDLIDKQPLPSDSVHVCWECRAVLAKFLKFRSRAQRAGHILEAAKHGVTESALASGLSTLRSITNSCYDAQFTHDSDQLREVVPKQEPHDISDIEVWADPAVPEYDVEPQPPEVKLEVTKNKKVKRGRPQKQTSADKFEAFHATSADLLAYRQRAFYNIQIYAYKCSTCIIGFTTEGRMLKHNEKYHSEMSGQFVCEICCRRSPTIQLARQHAGVHSTMYRCRYPQCQFLHVSSSNVKAHYSTHEQSETVKPSTSHPCDLCPKRFRTAQGLSVHRQTHTSRQSYECHHCGKVFRTRTQIHLHMPHHSLKVMCDICGKRLPNQRRLNLHALAHLDPSHRPHECPECRKRFIDKYKLLVHSRQHSGEKPFKCQICTTEYVSKEQLTQHIKKHHSDGAIEKKVYEPRTKSLFRNERIFQGKQQKRLQIKHEIDKNDPDKPECNICGKKLSTNQNLQAHYGVHSNERPIKCDECDRTFKYKPQLYAHKLRHRGDKAHQCNMCGARFAFKTILNTHLKSHSSEKPFKCGECDLSFKYNSGLWTHKLIHKGEKPHQCNVCGARFTLKGNLTGHMKTHTNERPFECTLCGRKFPWRRNLKNHYKTHAKEQRVIDIQ